MGHRPWLDGLRGVAVLLVLAGHLFLAEGGALGVDLFFVLSGFLITCILLEEHSLGGTFDFRRFYINRVLRLAPALAALLIGGMLYTAAFRPDEAAAFREQALCAAFYVSNLPWLHGVPMPVLGHTWSLSVEEQFYFLWPLMLWLLSRSGLSRRGIAGTVVAAIFAVATLRLGLHHFPRLEGDEKYARIFSLYIGSHTRADSLFVGCLAAMLVSWDMLPRTRSFQRALGGAAAVCTVYFAWLVRTKWLGNPQLMDGLYTGVAVMTAVLIVRMTSGPSAWATPILEAPLLRAVGGISYGVYLYHMPVIIWGGFRREDLGWSHPGNCLIVLALTFTLAILSYRFIERPFLRLKLRAGPVSGTSSFRKAA